MQDESPDPETLEAELRQALQNRRTPLPGAPLASP